MSTTKSQAFLASGTFTVPPTVSLLWVTQVGSGSGGNAGNPGGSAGAGGGAAATIINMPYHVTPGGTVAVTVAVGGPGGTALLPAGTDGQTTSFGTLKTDGGTHGNVIPGGEYGGFGGGAFGVVDVSGTVPGTLGQRNAQEFGGSNGGTSGANSPGLNGGGSGGFLIGGAGGEGHPGNEGGGSGGGGGGATVYGRGGDGGGVVLGVLNPGLAGNGVGSGGGGGSAEFGAPGSPKPGGNGGGGYVLVSWIDA